ncbi:MAG TPA: hypothetical protein PKY56_12200 [Candidatus Kapabacteria bacterium]|nr:hypothetical protein [Candidatus Kapabacteria bacterium]HPO62111.1 hypothetical protein [Candidatus Kapabacteria bacterium]
MKNQDYTAIIPFKIQMLVSYIIEKLNLDFKNALEYLYSTELYEVLTDEESKIWHLTTEKLFELLEYEKENKELIFPDFV